MKLDKDGKKLLFVDIETSSINFKIDDISNYSVITEIGIVIADTKHSTAGEPYPIVDMFSKLINQPNRPPMEEECFEITHISEEMLNDWGIKPSKSFCDFLNKFYFDKCDYIIASNGNNFDRPILENFFSQFGSELSNKVWIDIQRDVDYPRSCRNVNQTYLSGYHNVFNCLSHRSVTDCMTMAKILSAMDINGLLYPLNDIIENALSPTVKVQAKVSFEDKDLAKNDKFMWDPSDKIWYKNMRENSYNPDNFIFDTVILDKVYHNKI
jgi:DNA polymerase III subunit epsilon